MKHHLRFLGNGKQAKGCSDHIFEYFINKRSTTFVTSERLFGNEVPFDAAVLIIRSRIN